MKHQKLTFFFPGLFLFGFSVQLGYALLRIDQPISMYLISGIFLTSICMMKNITVSYPRQLKYMILWLIYTVIISLFISPFLIGYEPKFKRIIYEAFYFILALFYMLIGYNITRLKQEKLFWKIVSYITIFIAAIVIPSEIFKIEILKKWFYLSGVGQRFQGIAGNPNDYVPIALVAMSYFLYSRREKKRNKLIAIAILLISISATGSKGALLTLLIYLFAVGAEYIFLGRKRSIKVILLVCAVGAVFSISIVLVYPQIILPFIYKLSDWIPGVRRIADLLSDPIRALSGGGSLRIETWTGAIMQIKISPVLGVGIGSSERVLETLKYPYSYLTPHNIYLELIAKSGFLWFVFIAYSLCKLLKCTYINYGGDSEDEKIIRHGILLLLINGICHASDWCLVFWILIGFLLWHVNSKGKYYETGIRDGEERTVENDYFPRRLK